MNIIETYCWWKKFCTSWCSRYPSIQNGFIHSNGGLFGISESSTVCYAQLLPAKRYHRPLCFTVVAFLTKQFQDRAVDGVGQLNIRVLHVLYTVTTFKVGWWENSLDCISDVGQFVQLYMYVGNNHNAEHRWECCQFRLMTLFWGCCVSSVAALKYW